MKLPTTWPQIVILVIFVAIIYGLCMCVASLYLEPKGRVSCADFGPYDYPGALHALKKGATWLDKDHDGIPCETVHIAYLEHEIH